MLAITSVIVKKCIFICYLTFHILQVGSTNVAGSEVTFPLLFISTNLGALINALINALKN